MNMNNNLKTISSFLIVIGLLGCQANPSRNTQEVNKNNNPFDYDSRDKSSKFQSLIAEKNLYLNKHATVKLKNKEAECPVEVQAHRGDHRWIENTSDAVRAALLNGFDVIEIDVQKLSDGRWVAYHDERVGRAGIFLNGSKPQISRLNSKQFSQIRLRSPDNELTTNRPDMLRKILKTFSGNASPGQQLNIEIKSEVVTSNDLTELNYLVKKYLADGQLSYSSSSLKILGQLREINKRVYLGLIQHPHPTSVNILKQQLKRAVKNESAYQKNSRMINMYADYRMKRYRRSYKDYTSSGSLSLIKSKLGTNAGLHLDIRRFAETPNVMKRARVIGLTKIATYTINGHEYHQKKLNKLVRSGKTPDSVIVDDTVYRVCRRAFPYKTPVNHVYADKDAMVFPDDVDFQNMSVQKEMFQNGRYINLEGKMGYLNQTDNMAVKTYTKSSIKPIKASYSQPYIPEDKDIDLTTSGPVTISFPK